MNILLVGSGGREHALAWKIAQSPLLTKLYAAPGNPGIAEEAELVSLDTDDHRAVIAFSPSWRGEGVRGAADATCPSFRARREGRARDMAAGIAAQ